MHIRNGKVEREKREITTQQLYDVTPLPKIYITFYFHFSQKKTNTNRNVFCGL